MTKNANFCSNLAVFKPKIQIFMGESNTFGTLTSGNLLDTCFVSKILTGEAPMGQKGTKSQSFGLESRFFVKRSYQHYARGYPKKIFHPKKISVAKVGVIFRGSSWILAILGQCLIAVISTLNFGPWSTKLGGTVRATKKITHIDNGLGPG